VPVIGAVLVFVALPLPVHGQRSVTLAWDPSASSGIAGYRLYEGGASRSYTNVIAAGKATTATASNLLSGASYFFAVTAVDTNGLESDFSNEITYTVPLPNLTFAADSGTFTAPFIDNNGLLSQSVTTGVTNGGQAVYTFDLARTGNYEVSAMVIAPSQAQNSFYVNVDSMPTDPLMIWDVPICTNLTSQTVSWRGNGNGDPATDQYIPKAFALCAGTHQLFIIGREANTTLGAISITALPPKLHISLASALLGNLVGAVPLPPPSVVLNVTGLAGQVVNVLRSQDLSTWTAIGSLTLDDTGSGQFTDPGSTGRPISYYRVQAVSETPPKLQLRVSAGGPVVLSGTGPAGRSYEVQCTENFQTWTIIGTTTLDIDGSFAFTDPAGNSRPRCFYRLQAQ
jgi:hypothetical protein